MEEIKDMILLQNPSVVKQGMANAGSEQAAMELRPAARVGVTIELKKRPIGTEDIRSAL